MRKTRRPGSLTGRWLAWLFIVHFTLAAAGATTSSTDSVKELNAATVSTFAGAEIPAAMRSGKIPGAVFVVVRAGRVVCEKAYGVTDLKTQQPVSPDQTLFRVASISKIFTAASALQLVQAHLLDLHRNVNAYLTRFQIAPAFGAPVTLFNLLTHSSGFDDCRLGYAARSAAARLSLRTYLTRHEPARVRPPGLFSVYDNYGFTLAGYLVQKVSGTPFAEFVREQILNPLDMAHSSFAPDAAQRRNLAAGYWLDGETPCACARSHINITPAAGLCTTASDMADFLVALLTDRRPDGSTLFSTNVISGLETQQFASAPEVPGRCYGFNCVSIAGRAALRQTGQWPGFDSVLLLFPKSHCGLFLAYNLCDYLHLERRVSRRFVEQFIPPDLRAGAPERPGLPAAGSIRPLLGTYLSARSPHDAPELGFPHEVDVVRAPDGQLEIGGQPYREIKPLLFERIETDDPVATAGRRVEFYYPGRDGDRACLVTQNGMYRRATWLESARGWRFLVTNVSIILLSAVILWPVMVLMRFVFGDASPKSSVSVLQQLADFSPVARGTAFLACLLALWFETSFALVELRRKPFAELFGFPAPVRHLLWALPVLLVLAAALALFSIVAWRRRIWHPAHRLHYTMLAVALGLFLYAFYLRHLLFAV